MTWPIAFNPSSSLMASILPQFRGSQQSESAKDSVRYLMVRATFTLVTVFATPDTVVAVLLISVSSL
jgi:hypothetical protein